MSCLFLTFSKEKDQQPAPKIEKEFHLKLRENLREEFDEFFNNLLHIVRKDWNLFTIESDIAKETKKFSTSIKSKLEQIMRGSQ